MLHLQARKFLLEDFNDAAKRRNLYAVTFEDFIEVCMRNPGSSGYLAARTTVDAEQVAQELVAITSL